MPTGTVPAQTQTRGEDATRRAVIVFGTGTRSRYERDGTIDGVFAQRASERPSALAVQSDECSRTYAEVDRDASRIANYLIAQGVRPGTAVGAALERSVDLPAALLGILRAGSAYVPLDPSYPSERVAFMIEDASVAFVMTDDVLASALKTSDDRRPVATHHPQGLAYVMYTSGSTGRPKGVAVEHRGVLRLVRGLDFATVEPSDTFLHLAPLGFDASTFEIWAPLLNGARLATPPPGLLAMDEIAAAIDRHAVTTLWLTAATFRSMVDEGLPSFGRLRQLLTGGDVVSPAHAKRFMQAFPGCRLINGYGPTENTTFSCCHPITPADAAAESIPIGRPIANSSAYVLDESLEPVPVGVVGELCVGGDGVACGYVNLPELTTERFVPDPFSSDPAARLYRTGDRARWRADGVLEFLGRSDGQVKVRGFRIELGEIESALRKHEAVLDAAAVVAERNGFKDIIAHVVLRTGAVAGEQDLRAHLKRSLPGHAVPNEIVVRRELPSMPSGKLDRVALAAARPAPRPAAPRFGKGAPVEVEQTIGSIWNELLGSQRDLDENFFDAGGDSLRLLSVHARIRERFDVAINVTDLFEHCTIRKLAAFVARAQAHA